MSMVELQKVTGLSANDISSLKETVAQAAIKSPVVTGMTADHRDRYTCNRLTIVCISAITLAKSAIGVWSESRDT